MEITTIHSTVHRIDHSENLLKLIDDPNQTANLATYISAILKQVIESDLSRKYKSTSDSTQIRVLIDRMITEKDFLKQAEISAKRLLEKEKQKQAKMAGLKFDIQKGLLIHALVKHNGVHKVVITKTEYMEILEDGTFEKKEGAPTKRKIYKSFLATFNASDVLESVHVYDTGHPFAKYWWEDYLELTEEHSNEFNTLTAWKEIKDILTDYKKDFPNDYTYLHNSVLAEFKSDKAQFNLDTLVEGRIRNYSASNENFPVEKITERVQKLKTKKTFDPVFEVVPKAVKTKDIQQVVILNEQMDLQLKDHIEHLNNIVKADLINRQKWIRIKTDSGYDAFFKS